MLCFFKVYQVRQVHITKNLILLCCESVLSNMAAFEIKNYVVTLRFYQERHRMIGYKVINCLRIIRSFKARAQPIQIGLFFFFFLKLILFFTYLMNTVCTVFVLNPKLAVRFELITGVVHTKHNLILFVM